VLRASLPLLGAAWLSGCSPEVLIASGPGVEGGAENGGSGAGAGTAGGGGAGATGGAENVSSPRVIADSVADFSLEQGQHGWFYGYSNAVGHSGFTQMGEISVIEAYVPPSGDVWDCWLTAKGQYWTQVFRLGAHPNGVLSSAGRMSALQLAVRRWVSSVEGDITISGELAKIDTAVGSNGIDARVVVDGVPIYEAFIAGTDGGGLAYDVAATVQVGSTVDFVLDPHESTDHHDLTRFTAVIHR